MTASISLFAMLGGASAEPAAAAQPQGEDAALFAAALVAALQQLQTPVAVKVATVPPQANGDTQVAEGEIPDDEAGGEPAGECGKSAATLGQLLGDATVVENELAGHTSAPVEAGPGSTSQRIEGKSDTPRHVDVVSDEPALPAGTDASVETESSPTTEGGSHCIGGDAKQTPPKPVARPQGRIAADVDSATVGREKPEADDSSQATSLSAESGSDRPRMETDATSLRQPVKHKTRTASKGVALVGDWSPVPSSATGWKLPVEVPAKSETLKSEDKDGGSNTAAEDQSPVPAAAPVTSDPALPAGAPLVAPMPTVTATMPAPVAESKSDSAPEAPRRAAPIAPPALDPTVNLDSPSDPIRQAQVANARLAAQLADLVGDHNVTDFRVELSKVKRRVESSDAPVQDSVPEGSTSISDPAVAATPRAKTPVIAKGEARELPTPLTSSPKPAKSDADPIPAKQTVTANRLLDLTEGPAIAEPLRSARAAAGPIVPDVRKEIPAPPEPAKKSEAIQPERPRAREDAPSDTPTAASSANPNRAESLTSRNDTVATRETHTARDLPNEGPGNDRPAGNADRVTVQVSDAEGRQTRIRVSVLGDQVRAVIVPPDSESARQLEQRMDDLQTALARQGFASSKVLVQQAGETAVERNSSTFARMANSGESKATSPGREQPAGEQRQGRGQREQQQHPGDGHRHPNGRSRDQGAQHRRRFSDV